MPIYDLIGKITSSAGPNRALDAEIALAVGYRSPADPESRLWSSPDGKPINLPYFTLDIDHALLIAEWIDPGHVGGCSWEQGIASARVGAGPYMQAHTPALALCAASLATKLFMEQKRTS